MRYVAFVFMFGLSAGVAVAQTPPPKPPQPRSQTVAPRIAAPQTPVTQPQAAVAQVTTATYGDWTLRCVAAEGTRPKACEILQTVNVQGQPAPVSQLAIGRELKSDPIKAVVQLPVNVWLPAPVKLTYDAKQPAIEATYKRCNSQACFADVELPDEMIRRFRAATEVGKLEFQDQPNHSIGLPLSFKGLAQALDAFANE